MSYVRTHTTKLASRRAGQLLFIAPLALAIACTNAKKNTDSKAASKSPETEAYENAQAAMTPPKPSPTTPHALQYGFKTHRFEMIPPTGFELSQTAPPFGRMYRFKGKKGPEGPAPIFTVVIRVPLPSAANPDEHVLMDAMLADYAKKLAEYKRRPMPPMVKGEVTFERAAFTGHLGRHLMRGMVFVGAREDTHFVMFAFAEAARFGVIQETIKHSIDSFTLI
jgi:hypothetical protein